MNFSNRIKRLTRKRGVKVGLVAALSVAAVLGGSSAAMATTQINFTVYSPGNAGYDTGYLTWGDGTDDAQVHFTVHDVSSDGHGPYVHYIDDTGYKFGEYHLTTGAGTASPALVGRDTGHDIQYVDFWVCNGGTSSGNAPDGCYGRRAYNQYIYPGKGSLSLGNTTGLIY